MAEPFTGVGEKLISLMVPDVDPDLLHLILRRMAILTASSRADHEGQDDGQARVFQEQVKLLALIRDARIDQAQLRVILGGDPDCGDSWHVLDRTAAQILADDNIARSP